MSELMDTAVKEGIEMPGQKPEDAPVKDAKEAAPSPAIQEKPSQADAQPVQPKAETPEAPKQRFEDNPGFKNVLKQRDSVREELKKAQEANSKLMALLEAQSKRPEAAPSEQDSAAKQLRQLLGIDELFSKLETLDKRNSEFSTSQRDAAFDKEQAQLASQCEKFGLDINTVIPELQNWIDEHPYFGKADIQPGFYDIAFKSIYFDKSSEIAKRAAYAEQLKEKEKLKKANSEAPSPVTGATPGAYTGVKDKVRELIEKAGGITFPGQ